MKKGGLDMEGVKKSGEVLLSPEFKVALRIYEFSKKNTLAHYSLLVDSLEGKVSKVRIKKALDNLLDTRWLNAEWKKDSKNRWIRAFYISGEATRILKEVDKFIRLGDLTKKIR